MGLDTAPAPTSSASLGSPAVVAALRDAHKAGRETYGPLALSFDRFASLVGPLVARRAAGEALDAAIARRVGTDLFLASACEANVPGAWDVLHERFEPRLRALALRMLRARSDAEVLAAEVLGDLAVPPPRAAARTLLGTYDGSGSLFGWLAAILSRRAYGKTKERRAAAIPLSGAADDSTLDVAVPDRRGDGADPVDALLGSERASRFATALSSAWGDCTPNERFVLVAKFRGGVEQTAIATMLGVGAPRVTRLVQQVVGKLREAVDRVLGDDGPTGGLREPGRFGLLDVVQKTLATCGLDAPPTRGALPAEGSSDGSGNLAR
jgi:DNA-directed RNA polymerase specialized sigma24 family protein